MAERDQRLRAVTLNFWGLQPPLERRLELASSQLVDLDLDVLCMQEVRPLPDGSGRTTADVLADALGLDYRAYRVAVSTGGGGDQPAQEEGLAIASRLPMLEVRALDLPDRRPGEGRILLSARLDHPVAPLWCHTTHLHYRLDDGLARERQVLAIDAALREIGENPQILCGDFNAIPEADEIRFLRGLATLDGRRTHYQDAWLRCHPEERGLTWSAENPHTRHLRSLDVDRRIDYVFVTTRRNDGRGTVIEARVVLEGRDRDGNCASDHYGVLADVVVAPPAR
jgi:endonuclease/exonuclease/phosphatase family metal-dependent hydrolase